MIFSPLTMNLDPKKCDLLTLNDESISEISVDLLTPDDESRSEEVLVFSPLTIGLDLEKV